MESAANDTIAYIKQLGRDLAGHSPECAVLSFLMDLSFPLDLKGCEYVIAAVLLQREDPVRDLANSIYITIALRYCVTPKIVEAAIRRVIRISWTRAAHRLWFRYLPTIDPVRSAPPTNAEVIAGLARVLQLWQSCAEAYLRQRPKEVTGCDGN